MRDIIREVIASPDPSCDLRGALGGACRERRTDILFAGPRPIVEVGEPSYTHSHMTSMPLARGEATRPMKGSFCAAQEAHQKVGLIALLRKDTATFLSTGSHHARAERSRVPCRRGLLKFKFLVRMRRFSKRSHEVLVK